MTDRRFHDETLLELDNFAGASAWCWNFSTQIGASTATTAASARSVAIFSAVPPSVHPSDENPTAANATAPPLPPTSLVSSWDGSSFRHLGSGRSELLLLQPKNHIERQARKLDSETTQRMPALLDCVCDGASYQAASCGARQRPGRHIARWDGGPDWATPCRQGSLGSSTCRGFVYLDSGWSDAAGAPRPLGGGFLALSGSTPARANGFSTLWLPAGRRRACETSAFPSRRRPRASPGGWSKCFWPIPVAMR